MIMSNKVNLQFNIHPGRILKKHLERVKMTQTKLAELTGVNKKTINKIVNCKMDMDLNFAIQLEKALSTPSRYWIKFQSAYDNLENIDKGEQK